MTIEEFQEVAVLTHPFVERKKGNGYLEKYNLYSYKGIEYHECIYPNTILEYYVYQGKEISWKEFNELILNL